MGIAFGTCSSCTPKEYHAVKKEMSRVLDAATALWEQHIRSEMEVLAARRAVFIKQETEAVLTPLRERLHQIEMTHHRSYRYDFERKKKTAFQHHTGASIHVEPGAQIPLFADI